MISIAICDDDVTMTSTIEEMLFKTAKEQGIEINCAVFFDGSTLVENLCHGTYYDLIYLDIEMRQLSGIGAAELIRNSEIPVLIVYVSSHEDRIKELFHTEPHCFLSKPIDTAEFHSVFLSACERIRKKSGFFSYAYNKGFEKLPLNRISYFESRNRLIYIHTAGNFKPYNAENDSTEYRFYGKMNDVEKQLLDKNARFMRIHQSYLVNFDYIANMNFTSVTMSDGTKLQISEDRRKKVRTRFCTMAGMENFVDE